MAKVIYIDDNGNSEVLRDGNIRKRDIVFREDYFAIKLWCDDDISCRMEDLGYEVTPERVAKVINGTNWGGLNDCTDQDWYCIDDRIYDVLGAPDHSTDE